MEVSSSLQHLDGSFAHLAATDVVHSFRISTSSSFIDMCPHPDELFSLGWTTATSDFDFDLPLPTLDDGASSPTLQASASRIFRSGRLLPWDHGGGSGPQEDGEDLVTRKYHTASAPGSSGFSSPLFHSAPSTPVLLSPRATSKRARPRPTTSCAGRRRAWASPWKVLRFMMPMCGKVRGITPSHSRVASSAASPARGATSSVTVTWCQGSADSDVHDAILYCRRSSGQTCAAMKGA